MKRKIKTALLSLVLLLGLGSLSSCSSDTSTDEIQRMIDQSLNGQWQIKPFTVNQGEWVWNTETSRWECEKNIDGLTKNIYEEGAILGYLFLGEQGNSETQNPLPYKKSWYDKTTNTTFTETLGYFVKYNPNGVSKVTFTIEESDLSKRNDAPLNYNFRIVLIW